MAELPKTDFGEKIVIAARLLDNASNSAGQKFAFETTHNYNKKRDSKDTDTKDGKIYSYGAVTTQLKVEMISSDYSLNDMIDGAIDNNSIVEFWRVFIDRPGKTPGSYVMEYMRGRLSNLEASADADDFMKLSMDVDIDGIPQKGEGAFTVNDNNNGYVFRDMSVATQSTGA